MSIFDCSLFSGEMEHLLIRFTELDSVVDKFIIAESSISFQGERKELTFPTASQSGMFDKWIDKIIYQEINDVPGEGMDRGAAGSKWFMVREKFLRNSLFDGYKNLASAGDLILISDVDEIPKVEAAEEAKIRLNNSESCLVFRQDMYVWNRHLIWPGPSWDTCAYLAGYGISPQEARDLRGPMIERGHIVEDGGWHLTWQGTPETRNRKLTSFSHAEHGDKADNLQDVIDAKLDINGVPLTEINIDDVIWPKYFDEHPNLWV